MWILKLCIEPSTDWDNSQLLLCILPLYNHIQSKKWLKSFHSGNSQIPEPTSWCDLEKVPYLMSSSYIACSFGQQTRYVSH